MGVQLLARRLTPELPETTAGLGRDSVIALDLLPPRLYMRYALRPGHPHPDACGRISYEEKRGGGGVRWSEKSTERVLPSSKSKVRVCIYFSAQAAVSSKLKYRYR